MLDKNDQNKFASDRSLSCGSKSDNNNDLPWISKKIRDI